MNKQIQVEETNREDNIPCLAFHSLQQEEWDTSQHGEQDRTSKGSNQSTRRQHRINDCAKEISHPVFYLHEQDAYRQRKADYLTSLKFKYSDSGSTQ